LVAQSQILQLKGRVRTARTGEPVGDRTVRNIFQNVNTFFLQNPLQQVTPDSMGSGSMEDALEQDVDLRRAGGPIILRRGNQQPVGNPEQVGGANA